MIAAFLRRPLALAALAFAPLVHAGEPPSDPELARAKAMLDTWETTAPARAERRMHIVYWTPADTAPAPAYRERLTRVLKFTQNFYASQLDAYGFGRRSIRLDLDAAGLLNLPVARGSKPFSAYRTESGPEIRNDCVAALKARGIDASTETIVIFCNLAIWDPVKRTMRQQSPYYACGTHRTGTAWQVDSPLLDSDLLGVKDGILRDAQYGAISVGRYNSIFVGGVVHELGHALGLPHCAECPADRATLGHALMGSGNRTMGEGLRGEGKGTFITRGHALKLAAHPQFSGSVKGMGDDAKVTWANLTTTSAPGGAHITGRVISATPIHAVLAYADPEGGGDYDATLASTVPDADGRFAIDAKLSLDSKAPRGEIRLVAVGVNGAATAYAYSNAKPAFPYAKNNDGSAAVSRTALESPPAAPRASPARPARQP